jgi:hypothetical protein
MTTISQSHRTRRYVVPATIPILIAGSSVSDLARVLGVTQSCASHYLAGRRRVPFGMRDALVQLVGDEAASRVLELIPTHPGAAAA